MRGGPNNNRANLARLAREADRVVHLLLHTPATLHQVKLEYRVSNKAVLDVYHARTTQPQRTLARCRKMVATKTIAHCARGGLKPIGTIVVRRKGKKRLRWIKVKDHGPNPQRWVHYGRWRWEQAHGQVPAGCRIVHADGRRLNDDLENLVCMTEAEYAAWHAARDTTGYRRSAVSEATKARWAAYREQRRIQAARAAAQRRPAAVVGSELPPSGSHRTTTTPASEVARARLASFLGQLENVA